VISHITYNKIINLYRKSQISIEYSYMFQEKAPDTWVFWISAVDTSSVERGYRRIASGLGLEGANDPKTDIFLLVSEWLTNVENAK
jgi:hypothetical protein